MNANSKNTAFVLLVYSGYVPEVERKKPKPDYFVCLKILGIISISILNCM